MPLVQTSHNCAPHLCPQNELNNLFTFKDSGIQKVIGNEWTNFTFHFIVENGGLFYLYFANCEQVS